MSSALDRSWVRAAIGCSLLLASLTAQADAALSTAEGEGTLRGVVVDALTGDPVEGAYVGVGDFGDSGGSNYARHRAQGLYASARTDAEGRFVLDGLAVGGDPRRARQHPLVVTHRGFVPWRQHVGVAADGGSAVRVQLTRGAVIEALAVDGAGTPLAGPALLRLVAADGHRFIPLGRDPHLSSFAASSWSEVVGGGSFTFGALAAGEYQLSVVRLVPAAAPFPGLRVASLAAAGTRYHGAVRSVRVASGETQRVRVEPEEHGTRLTVTLPLVPEELRGSPLLALPFVFVSENPGLVVWLDGRPRSLEDGRLGRIQKSALLSGAVPDAQSFVVENLPPGAYSFLAGAAGYLQGARFEIAVGDEKELRLPWRDPGEFGRVSTGGLDRVVALERREYSLRELCELMTRASSSRPRFRAREELEARTVEWEAGSFELWELVERLHVSEGWRVEEEGPETLVIVDSEG